MTLRKLDEAHAQKLQTLKQTFKILEDRVLDCPWFARTMKDHMLTCYNQASRWADWTKLGWDMSSDKISQQHKDEYRLYHRLQEDKYDLLADLKKELEYVYIMIAKRTITDHQIDLLTSKMNDGLGVSIIDNAHFLNGGSTVFGAKGGAQKVYDFIFALQGLPEVPAPVVPRTFYLANTSNNKTDKEGYPFYYPMKEHGVLDTTAEVSMTSTAIGQRRRRYGTGPTRTHESMIADEKREAKQAEKRVAQYNEKKQRDKDRARSSRERVRDQVRKKNKEIIKQYTKEQEERRGNLAKSVDGRKDSKLEVS